MENGGEMNVRNEREHHFTVYVLVNCFELFDFDSIHCRRTIKQKTGPWKSKRRIKSHPVEDKDGKMAVKIWEFVLQKLIGFCDAVKSSCFQKRKSNNNEFSPCMLAAPLSLIEMQIMANGCLIERIKPERRGSVPFPRQRCSLLAARSAADNLSRSE